MALRGSYRSIAARLDAAEHRAAGRSGPGCPTCESWPAYPVVGAEYDPTPHGWPEEWRCPDCGREPLTIFRIVYRDWPPRPPLMGDPPAGGWRD